MTPIDVGEHTTRQQLTRQLTGNAKFTLQDARKAARVLLALRERVLQADRRARHCCQ